jgi:hypothetical protein
VAGWIGAAASRRGSAHVRRGEPRQDAVAMRFCGETLIAAVADGAGSASRGGAGAALACRRLADAAGSVTRVDAVSDRDVTRWFEGARERLRVGAERAGVGLRDLATTAILLLSDGRSTLCGHVGDGAAVARTVGGWRALSWPETGEHAGTTRFLTEDRPSLRLARLDEPASAVALLTDGMERLVLDLTARTPHAPFFDMVAAPLDRLAMDPEARGGRDRRLSAALGRYLDAETVCERTDDDKTLAIAVRRVEDQA